MGDRNDRDEDREYDHRQEPPEAQSSRDDEGGQSDEGPQQCRDPLAPSRAQEVAAELVQTWRFGRRGRDHTASFVIASPVRLGCRTRPRRARCRTPSATMRLPRTHATVPRPGHVVSPDSQKPGGPRSWGTAFWLALASDWRTPPTAPRGRWR